MQICVAWFQATFIYKYDDTTNTWTRQTNVKWKSSPPSAWWYIRFTWSRTHKCFSLCTVDALKIQSPVPNLFIYVHDSLKVLLSCVSQLKCGCVPHSTQLGWELRNLVTKFLASIQWKSNTDYDLNICNSSIHHQVIQVQRAFLCLGVLYLDRDIPYPPNRTGLDTWILDWGLASTKIRLGTERERGRDSHTHTHTDRDTPKIASTCNANA